MDKFLKWSNGILAVLGVFMAFSMGIFSMGRFAEKEQVTLGDVLPEVFWIGLVLMMVVGFALAFWQKFPKATMIINGLVLVTAMINFLPQINDSDGLIYMPFFILAAINTGLAYKKMQLKEP